MESYYGVIYFKDGRRVETGKFTGGPGAAQICERQTAMQFEQYMRTAVSDHFKPTRYEVKVAR